MTTATKARLEAQIAALRAQLEAKDELGIYEGSNGFFHSDNLTGWAATVARQLPHGSHRSLAGEWHSVADEVLAPVLLEFLQGKSGEQRWP